MFASRNATARPLGPAPPRLLARLLSNAGEGLEMRRRELLLVAPAMIAARAVRAQQKAMPVIGFLSSTSPGPFASYVAAFGQGLGQTGWVDGQNVTIEYRWAEGPYDRLPALAADLVNRKVAVIATSGGDFSALAAKNATSSIPIVFLGGDDPVEQGLVASLAAPGGNLTGVTLITVELWGKRVELISELVPEARTLAQLVNPEWPNAERTTAAVHEATHAKGLLHRILRAATESDIAAAFASLAEMHPRALLVGDPSFLSRREQIVALAARYAVPTIYDWREYVAAGGLISYGTKLPDTYRNVGTYVGKILKGIKPADLPVQQPTTFELVVNLKTAQALGLTVPPSILARANEVIE
jgi:putative tryptophan/tyrosine transport system substrate-binding protein